VVVGAEYVFVAVPRTASTAVGRWLMAERGGERLPGGHHRRTIPPEHLGKHCFAAIRNPATRLHSLWCTCTNRGREPLEDFVRKLINFRKFGKGGSWGLGAEWIWKTQLQFLSGVPIDSIHRFEELPDSLESLPFVGEPVSLPLVSSQISKVPKRPLTDSERDVIWEHSREDFEAFGYSP